jgi:predicted molibdopterin-dependent oxidoreductase YjgC
MNGMIPNNKIPLLEVNTDDLTSASIEDGEEVILQTESAEIQIKCKANNNLRLGLIRVANHAIINKLSNTKNRDYLNPQYKLVFANVRKLR